MFSSITNIFLHTVIRRETKEKISLITGASSRQKWENFLIIVKFSLFQTGLIFSQALYIYISSIYSIMMFVCLRPISSGTAGTIWLIFLLAPSRSRGGFWSKKILIRDPVFPEIRKNPDIVGGVEIELWYIPQLL